MDFFFFFGIIDVVRMAYLKGPCLSDFGKAWFFGGIFHMYFYMTSAFHNDMCGKFSRSENLSYTFSYHTVHEQLSHIKDNHLNTLILSEQPNTYVVHFAYYIDTYIFLAIR